MASLGDAAATDAQAGLVAPRARGPELGGQSSDERRGGQRDPGRDRLQEEEEEVDPRVQVELEKLNQSTDAINRLETELEVARSRFRVVLAEATARLDEFLKKLGKSVEESKPYWEARRAACQAQVSAQKATQDFQRASEVLRAAKETIALAEERLLEQEDRHFDSAWQEMLNHATLKVMKAEQDKGRSELLHKQTAERYSVTMVHMNQLERKLKRAIKKSRPYYELKAKYYFELERQKRCVETLQEAVTTTKGQYRGALDSLERISDEIHARRKAGAGVEPRGHGVGAETAAAFSMELGFFSVDGDSFSVTSDACESDACSLPASEDDNCAESCGEAGAAPPLDPTITAPQPGSGCCAGSGFGSGTGFGSASGTGSGFVSSTGSGSGFGANTCSGFGSSTGSGTGFGFRTGSGSGFWSNTGSGFVSGTFTGSASGSSTCCTASGSGADPESGLRSPVADERLGPRGDCSGASSPECEGSPPLEDTGSSLRPRETTKEETDPDEQSREVEAGRQGRRADEGSLDGAAGGETAPDEGSAEQSEGIGEDGAGGGGTPATESGSRRGSANGGIPEASVEEEPDAWPTAGEERLRRESRVTPSAGGEAEGYVRDCGRRDEAGAGSPEGARQASATGAGL